LARRLRQGQYEQIGLGASSGGAGGGAGADICLFRGDNTATGFPIDIKTYIDNVGSSTIYKISTTVEVDDAVSGSNSGSNVGPVYNTGAGYYGENTNPVTGIEVIADYNGGYGAFIGGSCSLYGLIE
jgi:hypothetical protein